MTTSRIHPTHIHPTAPPADGTPVSLDAWGFQDTGFQALPNGNVILTGGRYPLAGQELPALLPWIRGVMQVDLPLADQRPSQYPAAPIPPPRVDARLLAELRKVLPVDAITDDGHQRLRRGHGHSLEEVYAVRHGSLPRIPDLVVFPASQEQVVAIVAAAKRHDACLIPYGGGTNVTDALRCPPTETRCIVSVDLSRMDRVLWIDPVDRMACIQAGALGRHIQAELAKHGFTMGHEPDSVEFSTLGGWVATHASGMKKNRYGNIEDLVLDINVVTADGLMTRPVVPPRESAALDPRRWLFGSEGTLGIITQAVVKVFPLPEAQEYGSVLFPDFEHGMRFLYDLTKEARLPASVRLVDNLQFQLGQTLKPASAGFKKFVSSAQKLFVTKVKGFDPQRMVACTFLHEGGKREVAAEMRLVGKLAKKHGGMLAGAENGRKGYQLTFGIAYIRDFVMQQWILGESFETSVPWSQAEALQQRVKDRILAEHKARGLPGRPFITCRVTQLYQTGVCIYFYLGFYHKGVADPAHVYAELEEAARDEILKAGGSISHHHGVGKIRQRFLPRVFSPTTLEWAAGIKQAVDPTNVFGAANHATVPITPDVTLTDRADVTVKDPADPANRHADGANGHGTKAQVAARARTAGPAPTRPATGKPVPSRTTLKGSK